MTRSCLMSLLIAGAAVPALVLLSMFNPALASVIVDGVAIWATLHGIGLLLNVLFRTAATGGHQEATTSFSTDASLPAEVVDEGARRNKE